MVPILDQLPLANRQHRDLFESYGLTLNEWERDRTDRVQISNPLKSTNEHRPNPYEPY